MTLGVVPIARRSTGEISASAFCSSKVLRITVILHILQIEGVSTFARMDVGVSSPVVLTWWAEVERMVDKLGINAQLSAHLSGWCIITQLCTRCWSVLVEWYVTAA